MNSLVMAAGVILVAPLEAQDQNKKPTLQLWVPAYYYPFGKGLQEWDRLLASARKAPIVAIVNPDSGPGNKRDTNYTAVIARGRKAGVTLVGYLGTQYTKRSLADVKADVDRWVRFYPQIQGIHVDEQSSEAKQTPYYAKLCAYIKRRIPDALVLSNPGTDCAAEYLSESAADVVCLFERDKGYEDFNPAAWTARFPPHRFAAQAYQVDTAAKMAAYVQEAVRRRIGCVYFTDAQGVNPYDRLPSYWEAEVEAVRQVNQAKMR
jgi:hypothetical protein